MPEAFADGAVDVLDFDALAARRDDLDVALVGPSDVVRLPRDHALTVFVVPDVPCVSNARKPRRAPAAPAWRIAPPRGTLRTFKKHRAKITTSVDDSKNVDHVEVFVELVEDHNRPHSK